MHNDEAYAKAAREASTAVTTMVPAPKKEKKGGDLPKFFAYLVKMRSAPCATCGLERACGKTTPREQMCIKFEAILKFYETAVEAGCWPPTKIVTPGVTSTKEEIIVRSGGALSPVSTGQRVVIGQGGAQQPGLQLGS